MAPNSFSSITQRKLIDPKFWTFWSQLGIIGLMYTLMTLIELHGAIIFPNLLPLSRMNTSVFALKLSMRISKKKRKKRQNCVYLFAWSFNTVNNNNFNNAWCCLESLFDLWSHFLYIYIYYVLFFIKKGCKFGKMCYFVLFSLRYWSTVTPADYNVFKAEKFNIGVQILTCYAHTCIECIDFQSQKSSRSEFCLDTVYLFTLLSAWKKFWHATVSPCEAEVFLFSYTFLSLQLGSQSAILQKMWSKTCLKRSSSLCWIVFPSVL